MTNRGIPIEIRDNKKLIECIQFCYKHFGAPYDSYDIVSLNLDQVVGDWSKNRGGYTFFFKKDEDAVNFKMLFG